ncbi:MAG: ribosomal protein S18-alanine N-acetyltransferase [Burkholderiales bacterium]
MNARLQEQRGQLTPGQRLEAMTVAALDAVMAVEQRAYAFPWTRGNFIDSMAAGYAAQLLFAEQQLLGYFVAMQGVEETHLLNITVKPEFQGQGHASILFRALRAYCEDIGARKLWLEVRASNLHAQHVYRHYGFQHIGIRKAYYPAALGQREDAVVMSLDLKPTFQGQA